MSLFKATKQSELCPECGKPLQLRRSKTGLFLGCSGYPICHYLKPLQQTSHVIKELDELCPECGYPLQLKQGSFGMFIGCSQYPSCHFVVHNESEESSDGEFDCPDCGHKLVKRQGRNGRTFYGCSQYPHCKFTLAGNVITCECKACGGKLAVGRKVRGKLYYVCANKACQQPIERDESDDR